MSEMTSGGTTELPPMPKPAPAQHDFIPSKPPAYASNSGLIPCAICGQPETDAAHEMATAQSAASKSAPYGDVAYADPGLQSDGKKRYPIDTAEHCRAAWDYINVATNAAKYTPAEVAHIKGRILQAAKKFGVDVQGERSSWLRRVAAKYGLPTQRSDDLNQGLPDDVGDDDPQDAPTGCMVAFYPSQDLAQSLAIDGGEPVDDLHVTLVYLGEAPTGEALDRLRDVVAGFAAMSGPVDGELSGVGLFTAGDAPVTYASVDCPSLPAFRQRLVEALGEAGFTGPQTHGYTPHMTLAYADRRDARVPNAPLNFDAIWLVAGSQRWSYVLPGPIDPAPEDAAIKQQPPAAFDAETELIKQNKQHPNASKRHPFRPAQFPSKNGQQRCLQCGGSQPVGGACYPDIDGDETVTDKSGPQVIPVQASVETEADAAKVMQGIDAGVDQSLVLLRSTPDLQPYAAQARDLLQAIEEACDSMLEYFHVPDADEPAETAHERAYTTARGLRMPEVRLERPTWLPTSREFITEINGRTLITAQASTLLEQAMTSHDHYLWTQGRLVGADQPNRNGAQWSSSGLQVGQQTVPYGPLNWLHEDRHVIGTIAAAQYVEAPESAAEGGIGQNHIAIAAPVWQWLYPDEAAVIEMASDTGKFWYSMECISRAVACAGEGGCGVEVSYLDYMRGTNGTCEHMIQRSGVRQFVDPIFLGAAVIVPPVRPGWADADATVARQAASIAEKAYEDAGRPDVSASDWEQLMAQVVTFAGVGASTRTPIPQVAVEPAVPQPRRRIVKTVERDDLGNIVRIVEEE